MGVLVDGKWQDRWYDTDSTGGRFVRESSKFHGWVKADGSTPFTPEKGRYHLYVSLACPWAHRTLIFRKLKKLEDAIDVSVVDPFMLENGWRFTEAHPDPLHGKRYLYEIYLLAKPDYTGRVTVPVLWDKQRSTIVSNESAEIIRMLNAEFPEHADMSYDYYPEPLRDEIDVVNARVYDNVNNGVYRAGFATTQAAYEEAYDAVFDTLDWLEQRLEGKRYLVGDRLTEADIRLFTTLARFDPVYHNHFKCNRRKLLSYPNLHGLARRIYRLDGLAETCDLTHIKQHYYGSHPTINPTGIVPKGPTRWLD